MATLTWKIARVDTVTPEKYDSQRRAVEGVHSGGERRGGLVRLVADDLPWPLETPLFTCSTCGRSEASPPLIVITDGTRALATCYERMMEWDHDIEGQRIVDRGYRCRGCGGDPARQIRRDFEAVAG